VPTDYVHLACLDDSVRSVFRHHHQYVSGWHGCICIHVINAIFSVLGNVSVMGTEHLYSLTEQHLTSLLEHALKTKYKTKDGDREVRAFVPYDTPT
jgi:hypothetical protein